MSVHGVTDQGLTNHDILVLTHLVASCYIHAHIYVYVFVSLTYMYSIIHEHVVNQQQVRPSFLLSGAFSVAVVCAKQTHIITQPHQLLILLSSVSHIAKSGHG